MKRQRLARIEPGKSKFVEVNLTFSQSDEDALIPPPDSTVNVYFAEEKAPSKEAKESFLDGVDDFNRQNMESAIQKFNDAIRKNGAPYADALVYRGQAEQSLKRNADAVKSFRQALAARKSDYETEALLAEATFNLNLDPAEVEPILRGIIRRHPSWDYPRVVWGDILLFLKDYVGVERVLLKAIRIITRSAPAHLILADVLTYQDSKEKRERAVKEAQQALELFNAISKKKVSAARSLKGLSISHLIFGGGRFKNNTAMAEAHHMLAKTIARKAQFMLFQDEAATLPQAELDLALSAINAAKEMAKTDKTRLALVRETNALIYLLKEDPTRAIEEGEAALKVQEALPETHLTLTQAYVSNQRFAPAVDHLTRYIFLSKAQMSPDQLKTYQEELSRLTKMRDANRQKK
jgi:tetratricopeptide (TPR) repeat protein